MAIGKVERGSDAPLRLVADSGVTRLNPSLREARGASVAVHCASPGLLTRFVRGWRDGPSNSGAEWAAHAVSICPSAPRVCSMSGVVGPGSGGSCSAGLVPADPAAAAAATAAAPHSPAEEQTEAAAGQADQPLAVTTETTWCSSLQRLVSRLPMLHSPAAAEPPAAAAGQGEAAAAATVALARTNQRAQQAPVAAPLAAAGMGEPQVVLAAPGPTLGSFTCTFPPTAAPTVPTPAVATVEAAIEAAGQPGMGCIWHTDAEGYAEAAVRAARQRTSYTDGELGFGLS